MRSNTSNTTPTCGSIIAAYNSIKDKDRGIIIAERNNGWDQQQEYMEKLIEKSFKMISESLHPLISLTEIVYNEIYIKIILMIPNDIDCNIALLGGLQINTSGNFYDHFLLKEFKIINPVQDEELNLLYSDEYNRKRR